MSEPGTPTWLRWCDHEGVLIPTGATRSASEQQWAERLAEKLRQLRIDPEQL